MLPARIKINPIRPMTADAIPIIDSTNAAVTVLDGLQALSLELNTSPMTEHISPINANLPVKAVTTPAMPSTSAAVAVLLSLCF